MVDRSTRKIKQDDIDRLRAMKDSEIDYSDIPELTEEFWKRARRSTVIKKRKMK